MTEEFKQPTVMPVSRVQQILRITKENELIEQLEIFEKAIYEAGNPLVRLLSQDVRSENIAEITSHMMAVEKWRERICRWHSLAKCFVEHTRSDHFLARPVGGGKITSLDREAYQKKLGAGFIGLEIYLENLIKCIDSRTNCCKILIRSDL